MPMAARFFWMKSAPWRRVCRASCLRFLQDRELRRVGDTDTIKVDVRVLASTNEPLQQKMIDKTFREDLYLPHQRHPGATPGLARSHRGHPAVGDSFRAKMRGAAGKPVPRVSDEMMSVLKGYRWPGNVRELQNAVERAIALCDNGVVLLKDLPGTRAGSRGRGRYGGASEWMPPQYGPSTVAHCRGCAGTGNRSRHWPRRPRARPSGVGVCRPCSSRSFCIARKLITSSR